MFLDEPLPLDDALTMVGFVGERMGGEMGVLQAMMTSRASVSGWLEEDDRESQGCRKKALSHEEALHDSLLHHLSSHG